MHILVFFLLLTFCLAKNSTDIARNATTVIVNAVPTIVVVNTPINQPANAQRDPLTGLESTTVDILVVLTVFIIGVSIITLLLLLVYRCTSSNEANKRVSKIEEGTNTSKIFVAPEYYEASFAESSQTLSTSESETEAHINKTLGITMGEPFSGHIDRVARKSSPPVVAPSPLRRVHTLQ